MATLDRVAELTCQLGPGLHPGETLRAALAVRPAGGTDEARAAERRAAVRDAVRSLAPPAAPPTSTAGRVARRVGDAALDVASNTSPFHFRFPDLADPNGVAVSGGATSQAAWLRDVLTGDDGHVFALTDRRILVLGDPHGAPTRYRALRSGAPPLPYDLLAEVPAAQLRSVWHKPTLLARGRVELSFADGSVLAVSALKSARARELVAAAPG